MLCIVERSIHRLGTVWCIELEITLRTVFTTQLPYEIVLVVAVKSIRIDACCVFIVTTTGQHIASTHRLDAIVCSGAGNSRRSGVVQLLQLEISIRIAQISSQQQATIALHSHRLATIGIAEQLHIFRRTTDRLHIELLIARTRVFPLQQLAGSFGFQSHVSHLSVGVVEDEVLCLIRLGLVEGPLLACGQIAGICQAQIGVVHRRIFVRYSLIPCICQDLISHRILGQHRSAHPRDVQHTKQQCQCPSLHRS